ncbi:MAG: folate-binding protein YgfZ [Actinobacteria bacterium]|nr:folate-binding protein YgfZ [Actinomycetota bacterium]
MTEVLVEDGPDKGAVWHFGQPSQEQRALAKGEAWADLSHFEIIGINGQDRLSWLHSLTTQHLEKLVSGSWTSALILDPQGHIEHQFNLMDDGERTWLTLDAGRSDSLLTHLQKMKFMLRVDIQDLSGEYALVRTPGLSDSLGGPFAIVPRSELPLWHQKFNEAALRVGTWALEAERVATGRPRIGFETDYKSIPNELGLLNKSVHMNKGCYCGQETVAKIANLGKPPRRLAMLHLDGSVITIPARGADVEKDGVKVGFVGTVARHHELGTIALAVLKRSTPIEATLTVEGIPATQEAIH